MSLPGLVKNGEAYCIIEIHLINTGLGAYDPESYGDKIIVYRKIGATGSSEYKLKSEDGQTIASRKDELSRILMHLNIQPNNPIVILNQDSARAFLKDSDGKQLFHLFMQATQLQTVLDKLNDCHAIFLKAKSQFEVRNRGLAAQKKELEKVQARLKELHGLEGLRDKVQKYKCERAWLDVAEQEKVKRVKELDLKKISAKISELVEIIRNKDNIEHEIQLKINQFAGAIKSKQELIGEIYAEITDTRKRIDDCNQKKIEQNSVVKRIEQRKVRLMEDIRTLEASIGEYGSIESIQALRNKNAQSLSKCLEEEDEVKSLIENATRDVNMLRQTMLKYDEKQDFVKGKRQQIQQKISGLEQQLSRYGNNQNDPLTAYGAQMPAFIRRIEEEFKRGGFSKLPRGPMGRYVKVQDKKWRLAVESVVGGLLTSFCVNSQEDRKRLDRIRTSEFPNMHSFTVIAQKFSEDVYDTRKFQTPSVFQPEQGIEAPNIMDIIKIDDPVVMNCFIDQANIENVLLCTTDRAASALTKNLQYVPKNLKVVLCISPLAEYYPAPRYRSYKVNERPCRYIQVDTQELRQQLINAIAHEKQSLAEIEQELQNLRNQYQTTSDAYRQRQNELRKNEGSLGDIKSKINEIKNVEYPREDAGEVLRQELEETKVTLAQMDPMAQSEGEKLNEISETLTGLEKTLEILKRKREKVEREVSAIQSESDAESERLYSNASNVNKAKATQAQLVKEAQAATTEFGVVQEKLAKLTDDAEKFGPRCTPKLERNTYNRQIAQIEEQIRQVAAANVSIPEYENLVQVKESEYAKSVALTETFNKSMKLLTESRLLRFNFLKHLKAYFAFRVRNKFSQVLKVRHMHGNVRFNYKEEKLELDIAPRGDNQKTNTKALSGGERSYSTIAFLIALWSCCDSPFYFLDEYDVFTDQVNRFVMTKILIHEAQLKKDQFAFLTPQDMSAIRAEKDITIHRFADPIRGDINQTQG